MSRPSTLHIILLLNLLPLTVVSLTCYRCVYPTISPFQCLQIRQECHGGQRCLFIPVPSKFVGLKPLEKEKGCAAASQCGKNYKIIIEDEIFSYTTKCCDTDLCNGAPHPSAPRWNLHVLSIISMALTLYLGA